MDLDKYAEYAVREVVWLDTLLRREGVEALRASYLRLGDAEIRRVLDAHGEQIHQYLTTSKNKRRPILRQFPPGIERHGFLLATMFHARCGAILLEHAARRGMSAGYGPSLSSLLAQAAATAQDLRADFPDFWPYEGDQPVANDDD